MLALSYACMQQGKHMAVISRYASESTVSVSEMAHQLAVTAVWLLENSHRLGIPTSGWSSGAPRYHPESVRLWLERRQHQRPLLRQAGTSSTREVE